MIEIRKGDFFNVKERQETPEAIIRNPTSKLEHRRKLGKYLIKKY